MSEAEGLRRGLLVLTGVAAVGLIAELLLIGHWGSLPQFVPFALSVLAAAMASLRLARPGMSLWPARIVFGLCLLGGGFGVFEHVEHNYDFAADIDATATNGELAKEAITGANPALAPGAFGLIGLMGLLATWRGRAADHPA